MASSEARGLEKEIGSRMTSSESAAMKDGMVH